MFSRRRAEILDRGKWFSFWFLTAVRQQIFLCHKINSFNFPKTISSSLVAGGTIKFFPEENVLNPAGLSPIQSFTQSAAKAFSEAESTVQSVSGRENRKLSFESRKREVFSRNRSEMESQLSRIVLWTYLQEKCGEAKGF